MPRTSHLFLGFGLLVLGACLGANLDAATTPNAAQAQEASDESVDIRYARLFLRQSQLDLDRALETNRRMPGSFQSTVIDALRETVAVAQDWLDEATAESKSADYNPCLKAAEAMSKSIKDDYAKIREINRLAPNSVNPADLERAKVAVELAEVRIARARAIDVKSPASIMQMQIDLLREQMVDLYSQVAKLQARN